MQSSHITVSDLFCGAGGSSQGVRNYARRSGLGTGLEVAVALNHWELALETHNTNFPEAFHHCTDIQASEPKWYPGSTILIASPECFPAGTLVLCARGLVPIEQVKEGDHVLTHANRFRRVTGTVKRKAATVVVQGQGHPGLECTGNHPFYVRRQTRPWNNALRRGVRHIAEPEWMHAEKLADQDVRWATPSEVPALGIPAVGGRGMDMNADFWWFVGRWLADGTVRIRKSSHELTIACGGKKVEDTAQHLARTGLNWRQRRIRTAHLFETGHSGLAQWVVEHFGKLAHGKTIPVWCLGMQREWREALLNGYLSGDGHIGPRRTQSNTVSKRLAVGLRMLATTLGYHVTLGFYDQHADTIEGRKVNVRPQWMVTWENNRSQRTGWHDGRHAWSLVKQVRAGRDNVDVHCLTVEQDESFIADGIVVHNCVNHSVAKGRKQVKNQLDAFATGKEDPAAVRSRATMWDVVRFAEVHKYRIVITENVVDARAWVLWDTWLMAMHSLGYQHQVVFFNSMFAWPTPQSRDRMYVVFWRKGQRKPDLDLRPWAPCPQCGPVQAMQRFKPGSSVKAKYGTQYTYVCPQCARQVMPFYYAAINAIDWSVPAERIGERKRPLEARTMQRIEHGLKKYGDRPLSVSMLHGERINCRVKDATASPLFTQAGNNSTAMASPYLVETKYSHAGDRRAKGADDPLRVQTGQATVGAVLPFTLSLNYPNQRPVPTDEALRTVTANRPEAVVIPSALMMDTNYFTDHVRPMDGVLPVQTSANKMGFLTTLRGTDATALKITASGLDEPVGTISAGGLHHALVSGEAIGFLQSYYGTGNQAPLDDAMGTLSTRDRHALCAGQPATGNRQLSVEDLYFRMLKAHEVKAGMAFDRDYVVLGSQRDQVKQLGNAVTPPVMEMLIERCVQSLM